MYIENPDEEQQRQNQPSSAPSIGAGGGGGGAVVGNGGTSTGGNPSTIQPTQTNQPNQSFANVQDYLKANQQQGSDFGNQFVSTIGQGPDQAKGIIDTASKNAQNEIMAAIPSYTSNTVKNLFSNPTDTNNVANYEKQANAEYTGPTSFESSDQYTNAANATNTASQIGTELGSTGGREQLLQDRFGVYGQGNKGLDQTLLQNSSAYSNIPPLAQNFKSVQDYLTAAANPINSTAIPTAQQAVATTKANTANDVVNTQNELRNNIENRLTTANQKGFNGIDKNDLLGLLGVTPQQELSAFATPDEIAREQQFAATTNTNNLTPNIYLSNNPQQVMLRNYLKQFYS